MHGNFWSCSRKLNSFWVLGLDIRQVKTRHPQSELLPMVWPIMQENVSQHHIEDVNVLPQQLFAQFVALSSTLCVSKMSIFCSCSCWMLMSRTMSFVCGRWILRTGTLYVLLLATVTPTPLWPSLSSGAFFMYSMLSCTDEAVQYSLVVVVIWHLWLWFLWPPYWCLCRLSPSFLVSGGRDLTIKLWSLPQTELSRDSVLPLQSKLTQKVHDKEIQSLAVSPNDKLIASGSRDKKAKVVN